MVLDYRESIKCIDKIKNVCYNGEMNSENQPLFDGVDCVHLRVADIDSGLAFYRDALGLKLLWRMEKVCGLGMKEGQAELVISEEDYLMVDLKVDDVEKAAELLVRAGGKIEDGPFDIEIGKCAVVVDPWGNRYCILDLTKGTFDTNSDGMVSGVSKK